MTEFGLGRTPAPDDRDKKFRMETILRPRAPGVTHKYFWDNAYWGDQGRTSQCVAYAWMHWVEDGPITHAPRKPGTDPKIAPASVYARAQQIDEWEGSDYEGTSVRAGAKVLMEQGLISSYRWAWNVETVVQALLTTGPVVVGTWWYDSMFYPNDKGLLTISGQRAGGHGYVLNGVNTKTKMIRVKNSWGKLWAKAGRAWISFADMDRLIREDGEAVLAVEVPSD
jgi:hypothetical protein